MVLAPWLRRALVGCVLGLAHAAGADPGPPVTLEGPEKEAMRLRLAAAFAALPSVNQSFELAGVSPGKPPTDARIDLWRDGDAGAVAFLELKPADGDRVLVECATDGTVVAIQANPGPASMLGLGLARMRQRAGVHAEAARIMHARWGVPIKPGAPSGLQFALGVSPSAGGSTFKFHHGLSLGNGDATPSWLEPDLWAIASAEHRVEEGTVVLRAPQVETSVRTQDGLLLRVEAHDEVGQRHVLLTPRNPARSPADWRELALALCRPLQSQARKPHAQGQWLDTSERAARVLALLKLPQAPPVADTTLAAWAQFLVETEKAVFALDEWTPEAAATQRDVVHKALLAAIREMAPTVGWPPERTARFAAHVSARWAAEVEQAPSAAAAGGGAAR